jgi:BRCT domain type II-containing protein
MTTMSDASTATGKSSSEAAQSKPAQGYIHRVCIQCNNVFRVPADKFDAKQCPNCHKG